MAILYEIEQSGFADMIRSGIVVTGGVAQTANLGNYIYDISGYKVRTGYPKGLFSCQGCDGITDTSATTSVGLILAALEDKGINCAINSEDFTNATVTVENSDKAADQQEVEAEKPEEGVQQTLLEFETVEPEPKPKGESKPETRAKPKMRWTQKVVNTLFNLYDNANDETPQA